MDEQINKPVDTTMASPEQTTPVAQQPVTATEAPQSSIPLTSSVTARPAENLPAGVSDYSAEIAQLYDAQMAAQAQALENAYNQNLEAANYAKSQIAPQFTAQGNDLATQYERTRRNNNMQADFNGLNTGAGSQMALAQQSNYLNAFGKVRAAQAQAETEADRQIANLEISYKSAVADALAKNDYQKAAALMQEYQRRDNAAEEMRRYNQAQAEQDAKVRAAYGDFSGYANIYGKDTAQSMYKYWLYNNPDFAYANGLMSASDYYIMTGKYPSGSASSSSSGGRRRSGGGNSGKGNGDGEGEGEGEDEGGITLDELTKWAEEMAVYGNQNDRYAANRNLEMAARAFAENTGNKPGTDGYYAAVSAYKDTQIDPKLAAANANQTSTVTKKSNAESLAKQEKEKQEKKKAEALERAINIRGPMH